MLGAALLSGLILRIALRGNQKAWAAAYLSAAVLATAVFAYMWPGEIQARIVQVNNWKCSAMEMGAAEATQRDQGLVMDEVTTFLRTTADCEAKTLDNRAQINFASSAVDIGYWNGEFTNQNNEKVCGSVAINLLPDG